MVGVVALLQRTEARPRFHSVPVSLAGRDARASGSEGTGVGWGEEDAERNTFAHSNARDTRKHFLPIAVVCYVAFWIALAIHPLDRSDWLLENLLIFISVTVLALTYGKFEFSNFSYALIRPCHSFQFWLSPALSHARDAGAFRACEARMGYLAFGGRAGGAEQFFEIIEAVVARIVRPDLGAAYLGTQGDIWDAQKDMAAAFVGAMLTAIVLIFASKQSTSRA
ncbi:MAG: hypothetical protein DME37_08550 [Verrucomicrobia bacterium]|nr:MAG: hypothetical protein DME37_08550 [Verrucomicrobiota bacterium]